jgi:hypothetical protein
MFPVASRKEVRILSPIMSRLRGRPRTLRDSAKRGPVSVDHRNLISTSTLVLGRNHSRSIHPQASYKHFWNRLSGVSLDSHAKHG